MTDVVASITEQSGSAKANRYFQAGTVLASDPASNTAIVDVGATLPDGTPVYMHDIPCQANQLPKTNNTVDISYSSVSSHSKRVTGVQVGGNAPIANQQIANGGVMSLHADSNPKLVGDVELMSGTNFVFTQTGNTITGSSAASVMGVSAESGGGAPVGPESVINFVSSNANASWGVTDDTSATPHRIDVTLTVPAQSLASVFPQSFVSYTDPPATPAIVLSPGTTMILSNVHSTSFQLPPAAANSGYIFVVCDRFGGAVIVTAENGTDTVESGTGRNNVWFQSDGVSKYYAILGDNGP